MFDFFKKKKKVTLEKIDGYKEALKNIKYFTAISEWDKVTELIRYTKEKERIGYDNLIVSIDEQDKDSSPFYEQERKRQNIIYQARIKELNEAEQKYKKLQEKYYNEQDDARFKVRFEKIKSEIDNLNSTKKSDEALNLLSSFLSENKGRRQVVQYYNKEKRKILKNIEKQNRIEEDKYKKDTRLEALRLIGQTINLDKDKKNDKKEGQNLFSKLIAPLKDKFNLYEKIKEKIKRKKLLDEVSILIEEDSKLKNDIAKQKLANIHKGLIKELSQEKMIGYDFFGKILGADKVSGDAFGFYEDKNKYDFFIGDATGHGIRAGFIVTLLTRLFNQFTEKEHLQNLVYEINNGLKQDLKNRNFITGIFFEINKKNINNISYVGMGHEPMLIFRAKTGKVEKLIPGGLAAGIRLMNNKENIKVKEISFTENDILLIYSDGVIDAKSDEGAFYGIERLKNNFEKIANNEFSTKKIYDSLISDIKYFKHGSSFSDDVTMLIIRRNTNKDIIEENSSFIKEIVAEEQLVKSEIAKLKGKTKEEVKEEIEKIKYEKKIKNILKTLEALYYTGEVLQLKQECIRFIKDGFIHPNINFYLKKALENERIYKIEQKEQRIENKYKVMKELMKKGDYATVINESGFIIDKDGNI